jgi:hypothetical protein
VIGITDGILLGGIVIGCVGFGGGVRRGTEGAEGLSAGWLHGPGLIRASIAATGTIAGCRFCRPACRVGVRWGWGLSRSTDFI